jgi:hypothetical protein
MRGREEGGGGGGGEGEEGLASRPTQMEKDFVHAV